MAEAECATAKELAAATPPPEMVADRVVLAGSGVLLLLLKDAAGRDSPVDGLRKRCREAWPGAPQKQSTYVMHVSLCRVVAVGETSEAQWAAVLGKVRELSEAVKGMKATLRSCWFVEETRQMACGRDGCCTIQDFEFAS